MEATTTTALAARAGPRSARASWATPEGEAPPKKKAAPEPKKEKTPEPKKEKTPEPKKKKKKKRYEDDDDYVDDGDSD